MESEKDDFRCLCDVRCGGLERAKPIRQSFFNSIKAAILRLLSVLFTLRHRRRRDDVGRSHGCNKSMTVRSIAALLEVVVWEERQSAADRWENLKKAV
eukprot:scaffold109441_cov23-Cyclotella_meneghiniana.AAC.1